MSKYIADEEVKTKRYFIDKSKLEIWGYAISIFLISMPYFVWHTPIPITPFLLLFCLLLSLRHFKLSRNTVIPILGILLLYVVVLFRGGYTINGIGATLLILPIFLLDQKFLSNVFDAYVTLFSVTIIPSLIVYLLIKIFDLQFPSTIINPLNSSKDGNYLQYPFLVLYREWGNISPRFYGYYDEPGVVGTIAGVLLIAKNFNLKDKFNIPIFIAGLCSFSLYFLLISAIYTIAFTKTIYKLIVITLSFFFVAFFYSNEILYTLIFRRFEIIDGQLIGDNRMDKNSIEWYMEFQNSSNYLFGLGGDSNWRLNYHGASYKELIINYGLIFFILYIGSFSFLALKKIKLSKYLFMYLMILFSVLYQRPFIDDMLYVFLIYTSIFALSHQISLNINNANQ